MALDISLTHVLCAVYEAGSVSGAADRLNLTQPAVSHALGRLRGSLGDPLFVRTRDGMSPTPRAVRLYEQFSEALRLIDRAVEEIRAFDPSGSARHFRIAMSDIGAMVFLPPILRALQEKAPRLSVSVTEIAVPDLNRLLQAGRIDMALGNVPHLRGLTHCVEMFEESYVCLVRRDHPEIGDSLSLEQYLAAGHVSVVSPFSGHLMINEALSRRSMNRRVVLEAPYFTGISDAVAGTDLVLTLPAYAARLFQATRNLKVLPLPFGLPPFSVELHWSDRSEQDAGHRWLRTLVAELISASRLENMLFDAVACGCSDPAEPVEAPVPHPSAPPEPVPGEGSPPT